MEMKRLRMRKRNVEIMKRHSVPAETDSASLSLILISAANTTGIFWHLRTKVSFTY